MNTGQDIWATRQTLILRAKNPDDDLAWNDFENYYSGFIKLIIRKLNVPKAEHDDLSQEILLKVWKSLEKMSLNKNNAKFRTWLSTIIKNTVLDFYKKNKGKKNISLDAQDCNLSIPSNIDEMVEGEWKSHISKMAIERISKYFSGNAVDVFNASYSGKSTEEISREFNISTDTVYVLKNRVKSRLLQEIKSLQKECEFE